MLACACSAECPDRTYNQPGTVCSVPSKGFDPLRDPIDTTSSRVHAANGTPLPEIPWTAEEREKVRKSWEGARSMPSPLSAAEKMARVTIPDDYYELNGVPKAGVGE
jgi:hypothetical protein